MRSDPNDFRLDRGDLLQQQRRFSDEGIIGVRGGGGGGISRQIGVPRDCHSTPRPAAPYNYNNDIIYSILCVQHVYSTVRINGVYNILCITSRYG